MQTDSFGEGVYWEKYLTGLLNLAGNKAMQNHSGRRKNPECNATVHTGFSGGGKPHSHQDISVSCPVLCAVS